MRPVSHTDDFDPPICLTPRNVLLRFEMHSGIKLSYFGSVVIRIVHLLYLFIVHFCTYRYIHLLWKICFYFLIIYSVILLTCSNEVSYSTLRGFLKFKYFYKFEAALVRTAMHHGLRLIASLMTKAWVRNFPSLTWVLSYNISYHLQFVLNIFQRYSFNLNCG